MTKLRLTLTVAPLALMLAACGGGGTGLNSTPPPTPPPPPTPTPPPTSDLSPVQIFPDIAVSTDFAALGWESSGSIESMAFEDFSVRYDAATNSYIMDFPSTPPGGFHEYTANTPNAHWWSGTLVPPGEGIAVGVRKPSDADLPLSYTTLANYNVFSGGPEPFGWVAFGSPTPIEGVPVTGSATYNAEVGGSTLDRMGLIEGTATLQFNFGAGTLSGHFDPIYFYLGGMGESYALASYQFISTVYSSGFFAGSLDSAVLPTDGFFEGRFTGPNAEELMASWVAPYKDPLTLTDGWMFGVWVGKK